MFKNVKSTETESRLVVVEGRVCGWKSRVAFYAAERKKELIPFAAAWMELESMMLSEISQAVREKYHIISPLTGT